jgi:hypothetical protein
LGKLGDLARITFDVFGDFQSDLFAHPLRSI